MMVDTAERLKLFESIDEAHGIAGIFLIGGEKMRAVIIKLDRTEGKIGVQIVISAAAKDPAAPVLLGPTLALA